MTYTLEIIHGEGWRYVVALTERGFVVLDTDTEEVVRGTFSQRFKAVEVCDKLNFGR